MVITAGHLIGQVLQQLSELYIFYVSQSFFRLVYPISSTSHYSGLKKRIMVYWDYYSVLSSHRQTRILILEEFSNGKQPTIYLFTLDVPPFPCFLLRFLRGVSTRAGVKIKWTVGRAYCIGQKGDPLQQNCRFPSQPGENCDGSGVNEKKGKGSEQHNEESTVSADAVRPVGEATPIDRLFPADKV